MSNDRAAKQFIPFEFATGDDLDQHGFTKDESQQCVVYPEHMNVATRVFYDPRHHSLKVEMTADGRHSILFVPLGVGEMNDIVLNHTTAVDGHRVVDKTIQLPR